MKKTYLQNKIYFGCLSITSIILILVSFYKNNLFDESIFIYSIFSIIIILMFTFYFVIIKELKYYPINIFFNLYFLACLLFFFLFFDYIFINAYPNFANELEIGIFKNLSKKAILIIITTLIFLNLGFVLSHTILKQKKINLLPSLNETELLRLNFFLLLIKLFFLIIFYIYNFKIIQIENSLTILTSLISFYCFVTFKNNKLLNIFIIFYVFAESIFTTFSLFQNLVLLLIFFIIIFNLQKKISITILILIFCWVIFGQSVKNNVRAVAKKYISLYAKNDNFDLNTNIVTSEKFVESRPVILRITEPIVSLIRVLEYESLLKKEIQKDTLSILKYSLFPRFLYPDKPKQDYAVWFTDYFFDIYDHPNFSEKNVTYNISWPTDLYLNLRYLGITLISFLFGFILSFVLILFTNSNSNNINFLFGLSIFSGISLPDYNISLMASPLPLQFLFMIIIIKIILKIIRK